MPLGWASNKVKRVIGSARAAEALSLQMAISHRVFLRALLAETLEKNPKEIPIQVNTDSNNLYKSIYSTKFVEDKRLRIDIAQIQECVETEGVKVDWVQSEEMLADGLTKKGAKSNTLMEVMKTGFLSKKKAVT